MENHANIATTGVTDTKLRLFAETESIKTDLLQDPEYIDGSPWNMAEGDWQTMSFEQRAEFVASNIAKDTLAIELSGIEPDDWVEMSFQARTDVRRFHSIP